MFSISPVLPRVVLVHGFTQTARSWDPVIAAGRRFGMADRFELVAIDAPGHGSAAALRLDADQGAEYLGRQGPAMFLGYSMGGRLCLHLALSRPDLTTALVLVSATPGIADAAERAARKAADEALASTVTEIGVPAFIPRWLRAPMFASLRADAAMLESRLDNTAEGLASSLRLAGTGSQRSLWEELGTLEMPVLIVTGELDEKFTAIGSDMADAIGENATHAILADAGHACHLERPLDFAGLVGEFLIRSQDEAQSEQSPKSQL